MILGKLSLLLTDFPEEGLCFGIEVGLFGVCCDCRVGVCLADMNITYF